MNKLDCLYQLIQASRNEGDKKDLGNTFRIYLTNTHLCDRDPALSALVCPFLSKWDNSFKNHFI